MTECGPSGTAGSRASLRAIERASILLWRAHEERPIGGWLWRYSNGGSQRANSVATLDPPAGDLAEAIAVAEALYAARGAPCWFQISEVSAPSGLDAALAARGYEIGDRCLTLARPLAVADPAFPAGLEVRAEAGEEWFEAYASTVTPDRRAQARAILARVPAPRAFLALRRGGAVVATALCATVGPVARLKCVATIASARRTAAARTVVAAAMSWAAAAGARQVALGMAADNSAAHALYAGLGFALAGRYHIRAKIV